MWLKRFTIFLAFCTFLLLIAGGLVTSTGSGLAVPDWPLSYGKLMPPMVGGIFYEHGHRMIATFVGFLTVLLVIFMYRKEERRWVRRMSVAALIAVIVQGVLGGMTVLFLLPTLVSASHATLAQSFFCLILAIALVQTDWWRNAERTQTPVPGWLIVVPVAAVLLQLVMGALMRHSQAALAVPDFPLAYGTVFPSLNEDARKAYTDALVARNYWLWADGAVSAWQIGIHLAHRYWGIVLGAGLLWFSWKLYAFPVSGKRLKLIGLLLAVSVICQIVLGVYTVLGGRPVDLATAHQSLGAVVLGATFVGALHLHRVRSNTSTLVEVSSISDYSVVTSG